MRRLSKDYLAVWVTLLALTSQLFFGVVHTTALWVAASGSLAQVEEGTTTYSFLQICSAGGLVTLDGEDGGLDKDGKNRCPVCASAATSPMVDAVVADLVAIQQYTAPTFLARVDQIAAFSSEKSVYIRGPPAFSQIS